MRNYLTVLLFGFAAVSSAQNHDADSLLYTPLPKNTKKIVLVEGEKDAKLIGYFFNVQMGTLIGCNNCGQGRDATFTVATTHGVTVGRKLRGGIGIGFDSYANWQTLPVYGSLSWDLIGNRNKSALFLQMSYGWAHPWFVKNNYYNYYTTDPFTGVSGGRMLNPSIGYRLKYRDMNLSIGVGYKYQRIFYKADQFYICPACSYYAPDQSMEVTQETNRFQVTMSVGWR
ncbi:MAG TPA: hypothetical protein VL728_13320 [Cyclobacteriaceae bacterium]|jgi:hypothetical protein|nr:hypothetical protein [Cyclobacteriaceae bacterium]